MDYDYDIEHNQREQRLHASAVKFLIDGSELDEAAMLLSCSCTVSEFEDDSYNNEPYRYSHVYLKGTRTVYEAFYPNGPNSSKTSEIAKSFKRAFCAIDNSINNIFVSVELLEIDADNWKEQLQRILTGDTEKNQGLTTEKSPYRQFWQGLHFGSTAELNIAKALDQKGVMYFPGCMARLGAAESRQNREPDFLICQNGKWGILEVDGELFHQGRAAKDHERGRMFKYHGVKVVEHYDATRCRERANEVVSEFLEMLGRLG